MILFVADMLQTGRQRPKQDGYLPKAQKPPSKGAQLETTPPLSRTLSIASPSDCFKRIIYPPVVSPSIYFFPYLFKIPQARPANSWVSGGVMEAKFTIRSKIYKELPLSTPAKILAKRNQNFTTHLCTQPSQRINLTCVRNKQVSKQCLFQRTDQGPWPCNLPTN